MIKIGIDINNVIRDINRQIIKYYEKEFNTSVLLDKHYTQISLDTLVEFKSKISKNKFFYEDYPFEIFGCANTLEMDLVPLLNEWYEKMTNKGYQIILFSTKEHSLSIQSTFFFLSKIGCQIRDVKMFENENDVNNQFDIIITANPNIIKKCKYNTKCIGIEYDYNTNVMNDIPKYKSIKDIFQDIDLFTTFKFKNKSFRNYINTLWKKITA